MAYPAESVSEYRFKPASDQ